MVFKGLFPYNLMRRIESKEDIERRKKRNMKIGAIFVLGMLALSSIGYAFLSSDGQGNGGGAQEQGNVSFDGNRWNFLYGQRRISLLNSLEDVKNISIDIDFGIADYSWADFYIASENKGISGEIADNLGPFAGRMQEACYLNCTLNLPEKNCDSKIIAWRNSAENRVFQNKSCIFIEGDMRAADAFLYKIFGMQ